ncbi:MAG: recombination regulator RecX [Chlorobiaceae bacterium]|nr:recombination regulator RecX [Chlorobiaceae bacterium]
MSERTIEEAVRNGIRLLGLRAHGRAELSSKLRKKGFEPSIVEAAIARLESLGLINDRTFAESFVESMSRRRPEGKMKARVRLLQKGLPEEVVEEMLAGYDQVAMCRAAAEKKMRTLTGPQETKLKKLETFLRNRGFDWQTIKETMDNGQWIIERQ